MKMIEYIEDLLYRYECVILPHFGAFLAKRESAEYHESTNAFYPPKKIISFNRQLKDNDGLLANHISQTEKISYAQSLQKISDFVQNLQEGVNAEKQINLGNIGYFYTLDSKVLFQPSYRNNYLLEAFGTTSFSLPPIKRLAHPVVEEKTETPIATITPVTKSEKPDEAKQKVKNIPVVVEEKVRPSEKDTPVLSLQNDGTKEKKKTAYWKYAAVGLVAIGLGSVLTGGWYFEQVKTHNLAAQQKAEEKIENEIQQATFIINEPLPTHTFKISASSSLEANKPTTTDDFHIVAGAFRSKENAERRIAQLQSEGYKPHYIGINKYGLHQVAYQSFSNRQDALQALTRIRSKNEAAWLLVQPD